MYNVYLISCGEGESKKFKIGYTKNDVERRLKQLKTGNSEELVVEKVYQTKWGTKIESILHRNFRHCKISGEWFNLSQQDVDNFMNQCRDLDLFINDLLNNSTFKNPKTILR